MESLSSAPQRRALGTSILVGSSKIGRCQIEFWNDEQQTEEQKQKYGTYFVSILGPVRQSDFRNGFVEEDDVGDSYNYCSVQRSWN